jgi:hypothetical protein
VACAERDAASSSGVKIEAEATAGTGGATKLGVRFSAVELEANELPPMELTGSGVAVVDAPGLSAMLCALEGTTEPPLRVEGGDGFTEDRSPALRGALDDRPASFESGEREASPATAVGGGVSCADAATAGAAGVAFAGDDVAPSEIDGAAATAPFAKEFAIGPAEALGEEPEAEATLAAFGSAGGWDTRARGGDGADGSARSRSTAEAVSSPSGLSTLMLGVFCDTSGGRGDGDGSAATGAASAASSAPMRASLSARRSLPACSAAAAPR